MARNYGCSVYGMDLSVNMINIANELRDAEPAGIAHRCQFYVSYIHIISNFQILTVFNSFLTVILG